MTSIKVVFLVGVSTATLVFIITAAIVRQVNDKVRQPYMDEIFHVNQTQVYCQGNYDQWNPKITTPPGLYLCAVGLLKPVLFTLRYVKNRALLVCSLTNLRYLNCLFLSSTFLVSYFIVLTDQGNTRCLIRVVCTALATCLFPLMFFSSLLYYTDVLSTLTVLITYLLYRRNLCIFSGVVGGVSVLMRQTNIVWVAFCAALSAWDLALQFITIFEKSNNSKLLQKERTITYVLCKLSHMAMKKPILSLNFVSTVCAKLSIFIMVGCGFIIFGIVNGGFALGDKTAHTVSLHIPQFSYCMGFTLALGAPIILKLNLVKAVLITVKQKWRLLFVAMLCLTIGVAKFTYDHPYLIADNRHYTFYIWKNWFQRHWLCKFLLVPGYLFAVLAIAQSLAQQSPIWKLGFFICTALVTVPNRLLEFRYFIIPYVLWRLHSTSCLQTKMSLFLEFSLYSIVNGLTVYLFLYRPFEWSHEPGIQRFMW